MKRRTFISLMGVMAAAGVLSLTGCSSKDTAASTASSAPLNKLDSIQKSGKLVVALEGAWQPWSYHDSSDTLVGYDVEVSRAIAEKLGVEPEYVESDWDSLFAGLDAGRYDMVCNGVEVTEERAKTYAFTTPYGYIHTALAVRKDNEDIHSFEDLKGKTTANSLASTYMELAESYGATVQGIDTLEETIQLLTAGRIDATLNADVSFYDYLNVHPDADFKLVAQTAEASHVAIPVLKSEDTAYLDSVNLDLEARYSFLVVRKDQDYIYVGKDTDQDQEELLGSLPDYKMQESDQDVGIYIGGDLQALVKQLDFSFTDGEEGTAFIVTSVGSMIPEVESMVTDSVLVLVMILIFTSLILTAWIYKSIVTPIHHLQVATKKITDGNLDFEMPAGGEDEIGELCTDFEDMRRRLKETAEEKLESERQNKELISNISHDLKTPITAVKGYVEGIMDGVADTPEKQEKYIRTIYNKANDMERLINELTFYSKIDTNRIPYTFSKINVKDYFDDCAEELGLELEERGMTFTYQNHVDPATMVIADAEQILDGVPAGRRGGEWYFLKGTCLYKKGWMEEAYNNFSTACNMDPGNMEYRAAMNQCQNQRNGAYGGYNRTAPAAGGCNACDMCSSLICADCCCECMGGDLISCC